LAPAKNRAEVAVVLSAATVATGPVKSAWYRSIVPSTLRMKRAVIAASCGGTSAVNQYLSVKPSQPPVRVSPLAGQSRNLGSPGGFGKQRASPGVRLV